MHSIGRFALIAVALGAAAGTAALVFDEGDLGFQDTPILPGLPWHVHDSARPHPPVVTPGAQPGQAPSDAVVLFDGKDLSNWVNVRRGKESPAAWIVKDGSMQVTNAGDLVSKEKFGDAQYHIEWSSPTEITGNSQGRGNSGVIIMSRYEIQVLDAFNNPTYADGHAGAIYGQWPPLVNPARKPGEWNTYDIAFEAPRFENGKLAKPAYVTVFYNGVLVHHHKEIMGAMVYRRVATYSPHAAEEPLLLQAHNNPVRYRNIWVRRMRAYDQP